MSPSEGVQAEDTKRKLPVKVQTKTPIARGSLRTSRSRVYKLIPQTKEIKRRLLDKTPNRGFQTEEQIETKNDDGELDRP